MHNKYKVYNSEVLSPYKIYKLIFLKDERCIILVYLYNIAFIYSLQLLIVLYYKVPLSNKIFVIYKIKPWHTAVRALEFL